MIIGTVSFGGRAAAFFSASDMRMSRFSFAITRNAVPDRRAVALGLDQGGGDRLDAGEAGALAQVLERLAPVLQVGQLGGGQRKLLGELQRQAPTSSETFWNAASTDMPDWTQISSMSREFGKAFLIDVWRRCTRLPMNRLGR